MYDLAHRLPVDLNGRGNRLRARSPCTDPVDVVMPILGDYRWRKSDGRKGEQARCGPRDCAAPRPKSGGELDAGRGMTAKFREGLQQ